MDQNTLYEILECSVCMEVLDGTSRVLPCQHTFCRRCLDEIVATKKFLQCPECRMPVNKRVEDLPPNILLVRLLETMKTMAHQRSRNSRHNAECGRSSNRHATNRNANSTNSKPNYPCAKALYNYEAQEVGDLNFKRGDVVRLRKQIDENWYLGEFGSQQGYFPSTYVEVIVPIPDGVPACKALYDFVIDDENEKDCLTFQKAETIVVLRRVDDNWAEGKLGDRIGIFPLSFVELNDSAKCLIGCMDAVNDNWSASNAISFGNPLATNRNTYSSSSAFVGPSVAAAPAGPPLPMPVASTMQAMKVTQALAHHRPSVGVPSSGVEVNTPVSSAASLRKKPLPLIYEALYNYKPIKEDEIELKKGECYTVLQKCRDGWFKGRSLSTGVFGIFPGNYVKQIVLLPLDDVAFVQQSLSPATSASASISRGMPLGTGKHQAVPKSSSHATYYADVSENSSALSRRPRSRPITNITQAQIRNSGNSFLTSVANASRCHLADGVAADVGGNCSPTWLNLMTHPRSSTGMDGAPANSTSSGRHKVQRSATCRTRSVSRVPLSVLVGDQTMSDGLDSENLRTMLQGLSLTEPDDSGADSPVNGGCQVAVRTSSTVGSGSAHSADSEKLDRRSGLMKRWTGGMSKAKKPAQAAAAAATSVYVAGIDRNALGSPQPSATPERCANALSKSGGEPLTSQSAQKPMKVSLTKVLPVSLASVQSKNVNTEPYKCVMPYPAQNENELELKVGDIVFVTRKHDDGWFKGVLQRTGKIGLFPGSFVQNVGSSSSS